ncbi:MAG: protein kinase [Myxococcales bacterium]|nr:protein kinase [Myxococcales bacterium]
MVEPAFVSGPADRLGRYELLRRLGSGGMAEVHLARAAGLEGFQKLVVLKRILPHLSADQEFVRMFLAEARLAAILDHSNVVQVFDIGKEGADYFFTMEYVYGENLQTILRAIRRKGDALPLELAIAIAIGAATGLHYAHDRVGFDGMPLQIVHRDVSPTNVMVTYDGCVKVADFGIAKVTSRTDVTRAGIRKGKVPYMSPEQCRAQPLDRRSDVYALGIVLYECATMGRLFDGDNEFGVMNRIVNGDVPLPSTKRQNFPKDLERIIMKALASDRDRRYASGAELVADLERFARERKLRVSAAALGEFMHALFEPRPFPFGALLGTPNQLASSSSTGEYSGGRASSSVPAVRMPPDVTPSSHPSMTTSGRSRSQMGSQVVGSVQQSSSLMRGVAIGLGGVAALALLGLGGMWAFGARTPEGTAPATTAPAGIGTSVTTPAAPAVAPVAAPTAAPVAGTPAAPTLVPSDAAPSVAVPTDAAPSDAAPSVAAPSVAAPSEAVPSVDEAVVVVDDGGAPRPRKKTTAPKKSGDAKPSGEPKPDLDAFLPQ